MKTLYIHGLDSSPKQEKTEIMQQYSNVIALHLNYREQPDSFDILSDVIERESITHIIGSSLGGYLGFWLAEKYALPCLLFNPAIGMKSIELNIKIDNGKCPNRLIVVGENDDTVLPKETLNFLQSHDSSYCKQRVVMCNDLAHQIDLGTFEEFVWTFFKNKVPLK